MAAKSEKFKQTGTASARRVEKEGKAVLHSLVGDLVKRKVPTDSYIKINIETGEYVTGKSAEEAARRFKLMHPDAVGWMQRFGDVVSESDSGGSTS